MTAMAAKRAANQEEVSNRIFTVPNVISFIRLCLVPVFFVLLFLDFFLSPPGSLPFTGSFSA